MVRQSLREIVRKEWAKFQRELKEKKISEEESDYQEKYSKIRNELKKDLEIIQQRKEEIEQRIGKEEADRIELEAIFEYRRWKKGYHLDDELDYYVILPLEQRIRGVEIKKYF